MEVDILYFIKPVANSTELTLFEKLHKINKQEKDRRKKKYDEMHCSEEEAREVTEAPLQKDINIAVIDTSSLLLNGELVSNYLKDKSGEDNSKVIFPNDEEMKEEPEENKKEDEN